MRFDRILRPPFRPVLRRDPHQALIAALAEWLPAGARLTDSRTIAWASVTFAGLRHELRYAIKAADRDRASLLAGRLGQIEFALPGHFVADITAIMEGTDLVVEALTVAAD